MDMIVLVGLPALSLALISGGIAAFRQSKDPRTQAIAISALVGGISLISGILLLALFLLATGRGGEVIGAGGVHR